MSESAQHSELESKKEQFERQSPVVPFALASYLGRQRLAAPDHRLWHDKATDLAAWAHSRAHAGGVDDIAAGAPPHLDEERQWVLPIVPPALEWGAASHFQSTVIAALDSPVMHAWLYQDASKNITDVVITGRGIPSVRAQVVAAVLSCFFAIEPSTHNFVLDGIIHLTPVEPSDEAKAPASFFKRLLLPFQGGRGGRAELVIPENAAEAMLLLMNALRRLQDDTGFVQVHVMSQESRQAFQRTLGAHRLRAGSANDNYAWEGGEGSGFGDVVMCMPIQRIAGVGAAVRLELSSDLLDAPLYRELSDAYHDALVQDVLEDIKRRQRFYDEMFEQHTREKDWYAELPEVEKKNLPDVVTEFHIDYETGLLIRLESPGRVPASAYYTTSMDHKIGESKKWREMMRRLQDRIDRLLNHDTAPLKRVIAARLFDAAVRDRSIDEAPALMSLFERWKGQVQPLLWLEWRRLLQREAIDSRSLCNRHTTFNVALDAKLGKLFLMPYTIVSSCQSVVLFDRSRVVVDVFDGSDYAIQEAPTAADPAEAERLLDHARTATAASDLRATLKEALARQPRAVGQAVIDAWLPAGRSEDDDDFERVRAAALFKEGSSRAALTALRWMNESCVQSADEVLKRRLDSAAQPSVLDASAVLMRAYVKCMQAGADPVKTMTEILANRPVGPELDEAKGLTRQAHRLNSQMVEVFLKERSLRPQVGRPSAATTSIEEDGALSYLASLESASAAMAMDRTLRLLQATHETRRSAFYKIVPAIEQSMAMEFGSPPESLGDLMELLVGQKRERKS